MALRDAALEPRIFQELHETHREAGPDALQHHLIAERGFTHEGAKQVSETYRETMALAGLGGRPYSADDDGEPRRDTEPRRAVPVPILGTMSAEALNEHVYRWPLGPDMSAEVIFSGSAKLDPKHLERLRRFIDLTIDALDDGEVATEGE